MTGSLRWLVLALLAIWLVTTGCSRADGIGPATLKFDGVCLDPRARLEDGSFWSTSNTIPPEWRTGELIEGDMVAMDETTADFVGDDGLTVRYDQYSGEGRFDDLRCIIG